MKIKSLFLAVGLTGLLQLAYATEPVELLPAAQDDLVATTLSRSFTTENWPSRHVEQTELSYQHSLLEAGRGKPNAYSRHGTVEIETDRPDSALIGESRQYYVDTTGEQLAAGIDLPLTAPGAVIRLSTDSSAKPEGLSLQQLELELNGRKVEAAQIVRNVTRGSQLRASGWPVPENTLAFRMMSSRTQAGTLRLSYAGLAADSPVLVHVFEPNSRWVARLVLNSQRFLAGQTITASLMLDDGTRQQAPAISSAVLSSPDGELFQSMDRAEGNGLWQISAPELMQPTPGLYEIHLHAEQRFGDIIVRRDISHAVAIAPALARLSGAATLNRGRELTLELSVETSLAGRYQINATLYATDRQGHLQPASFSQTAAVLPAGGGLLSVSFDLQTLVKAGLDAPFELRDLSLLDQGRMLQLEHRQRALVIE